MGNKSKKKPNTPTKVGAEPVEEITDISQHRDQRKSKRTRPMEGVNRLVDYFHSNPLQTISIGEMIRVSGLGRRNLYYQFKKITGLPPQQYFKRIRLSHVRRELLDSNKSVAELASKYNFNHSGEFAALYKKVYGELPSDSQSNAHSSFQSGSKSSA